METDGKCSFKNNKESSVEALSIIKISAFVECKSKVGRNLSNQSFPLKFRIAMAVFKVVRDIIFNKMIVFPFPVAPQVVFRVFSDGFF